MSDTAAWASGFVVPGRLAKYRLRQRLGAGRFGEVWSAEVVEDPLAVDAGGASVAIKVVNAGLLSEEQQYFLNEAETIRSVAWAEHTLDLRDGDVSLLPAVLETVPPESAPGGRAFFVMTLASGTPLDQIVRASGALPEVTGLTIVRQFCRVLTALHEGEGRSYLDFQPQNIFWNPETLRITVVDWNLLSSPEALRVDADLLATGRLLYRLVMGRSAPGASNLRALSQPRDMWTRLSVGTRSVLVKLLAGSPIQRYADARSLEGALAEILQGWTGTAADQLRRLGGLVSSMSGAESPQSDSLEIQQARRLVSVLRLRSDVGEPFEAELARLEQRIHATGTGRETLAKGIRQFEAGGLEEAEAFFRRARDEAWDIDVALDAARWEQAAQVAHLPGVNRPSLRGALDELHHADFARAEQLLGAVLPGPSPATEVLRALALDASVGAAVQAAARQEEQRLFVQAAATLNEALSLLSALAYRNLFEERYGNLSDWAERLRRSAEAESMLVIDQSGIDNAFDLGFREGVIALQHELSSHSGNSSLADVMLRQIASRQFRGEFRQAGAIARIGLEYCGTDPRLQDALFDQEVLSAAWEAWRRLDRVALAWEVQRVLNRPGGPDLFRTLIRLAWDATVPSQGLIARRLMLTSATLDASIASEVAALRDEVWLELAGQENAAFRAGFDAGVRWLAVLVQGGWDEAAARLIESRSVTFLKQGDYRCAEQVARIGSTWSSRLRLIANLDQVLAEIAALVHANEPDVYQLHALIPLARSLERQLAERPENSGRGQHAGVDGIVEAKVRQAAALGDASWLEAAFGLLLKDGQQRLGTLRRAAEDQLRERADRARLNAAAAETAYAAVRAELLGADIEPVLVALRALDGVVPGPTRLVLYRLLARAAYDLLVAFPQDSERLSWTELAASVLRRSDLIRRTEHDERVE